MKRLPWSFAAAAALVEIALAATWKSCLALVTAVPVATCAFLKAVTPTRPREIP